MSAHDAQYIEEFQKKFPEQGSMVTMSFEWLDEHATIIALKHIIKKISEGELPDQLDARPISGLPCVRVEVFNKVQTIKSYQNEDGRLEIIEG